MIGEVVSYAPSLDAFFRRTAKALAPDGLLIFDFVESAARRTYPRKQIGGAGWALAVSARAGRGGRLLTRRIVTARRVAGRWRRGKEVHRIRIRTRDEVRDLLATAGFKATMTRSYGRYRLMAGDVAVIAKRQ
jgi:hypothetical protein